MAVWNRSKRHHDDEKKDEPEFVSLSDDEYAWWAGREELQRAWAPSTRTEEAPEETPAYAESEFQKKYSSESLFEWADGTDTFVAGEPEPVHVGSGEPFLVLGLTPNATWDEVVSAHRHLAKKHHPDRLQDADPEQRAASEQLMRRVNAAYNELRERFNRD